MVNVIWIPGSEETLRLDMPLSSLVNIPLKS